MPRRCCHLALLLLALTASAVRADDRRAETVLVTATREPRLGYETPAASSVIDREDLLERLQPRLLPEALIETPGIMVQKSAAGQASPYLRGFTGFRTLLLIDGVRINNSVMRSGPNQYWATVDPFSTARLETTLGPNGVLYGSDAVGGVVQAFTVSPRGYAHETELHAEATYRYGSADASHEGRAQASATWRDRAGLLIGVSPKHYGDLRGGDEVGLQPMTGFDEWDGDAKLVLRPSDGHELSMLYQHVSQFDVPRTHRTVFSVPFPGTDPGTELRRELDQSRDLAYLQLRSQAPAPFLDFAHLSLSWQRTREEQDRIEGDGRRDLSDFTVDTLGAFAQLESDTPLGDFLYGFDYYRDFVRSGRSDYAADGSLLAQRVQGAVADDASYDLLGVYVQWSAPIDGRFDVLLGGRFNYAAARARGVEDPLTGDSVSFHGDWIDFSGNLRALWRARDALHLYASVGQAFRAPNLSDLTRFDTARSNEIQTPSLGVDPERFVSAEIGAKTLGERWSGSLAFYYTWIFDGLIRTPTGRTLGGNREVQVRNVGDGYVLGFELEGDVRLWGPLHGFGNLALVYGEQDTFPTSDPRVEREPIDRMMPLTGLAGLRWRDEGTRYWAELFTRFAGEQDRLSTRDRDDTQRIPRGGTPGYATLNLRGGVELAPNATLSLSLENLTDETYRVHGSGVTAAGFGAQLSASLAF